MLVPVARAGRTPAADFTVLASLVGGLLVWLVLASYALGRSQRQAVLHLQRDVAHYVAGALSVADAGRADSRDTALTRLAREAGLVVGPVVPEGATVLATSSGVTPTFVIRAVEAPGTGMAPGRRELLQLFVAVALAATCLLGALLLLRLHKQHEETAIRSDFVRVVSHELRTPLSQILMFAETLRLGRTRTESDRTFALDVIVQEAQRLARLVDNVLRFTRLEQSAVTLQRERLDVSVEVHEVASQFTQAGSAGAARLSVEAGRDVKAYGDRDALRQVLVNLLDNAFRHGGANVEVALNVRENDHHVEIAIEDNGPGLHRRDHELVWAPFVRGERSQGNDRGTGLGLTIVRGLVSAMNGTVRHEMPAGARGARFVVSLEAVGGELFSDGRDAAGVYA